MGNEVIEAAQDLYDNRLNHRADNPQWNAPQELWLALGRALYGSEIDAEGYPPEFFKGGQSNAD